MPINPDVSNLVISNDEILQTNLTTSPGAILVAIPINFPTEQFRTGSFKVLTAGVHGQVLQVDNNTPAGLTWANGSGQPSTSMFVGDLDCNYPGSDSDIPTCALDMGQVTDAATNYIWLGAIS